MAQRNATRVQTLVIGGGQAGLSVGYYLQKQGSPFLIVDANQRVGDAWRNRWDSLRLFTPARYVLPGLRLPVRGDSFPTKDQIADYLQEYARHFQLPVQNGVRVQQVTKDRDRFVIDAGDQQFEAENLVIAMANYQEPHTPEFARGLDPGIVQIHSHSYRNPSQLQPGPVLVVGLGNSGADIAMEVGRTHPTIVSGKEPGHIPWRIDPFFSRNFLFRLVRLVGHQLLSLRTPLGRRLRPKLLHRTTSLIRVKPNDLTAAGIERVERIVGAREGLPLLADGRTLEVKNVIWCTGYKHRFPWIDLPIFDELGDPIHDGGIVTVVPGVYFVGLHFLYAMSSASFVGVGRDAERIAKAVGLRVRSRAQSSEEESLDFSPGLSEQLGELAHQSRNEDVHAISA
jgi:putative flavoprotein involved in K+ transport